MKTLANRNQATTIISSNEYPKRKYESYSSPLIENEVNFKSVHHKKVKSEKKEELKVYNPIKQFETSIMRTKTKYEIVKENGDQKESKSEVVRSTKKKKKKKIKNEFFLKAIWFRKNSKKYKFNFKFIII